MELAEKRFDLGAMNKIKKLVHDARLLSAFGSSSKVIFALEKLG
jgi:hypothetical protein